jgi:PAS domain S-box-containing protein
VLMFRFGLRGKVAALIAVTAVTAGAISVAALCETEKRRQLDRLRAQAAIYTYIVQEAVSAVASENGGLHGMPSGLQAVALRMKQLDAVAWLEIFDEEGRVVAHSESERLGQSALPEHQAQVRQVLETGRTVETVVLETGRLTDFLPVYPLGDAVAGPVGVVELVLTMATIDRELFHFGQSLMWVAVVAALAASMTLFVAIDRKVLRPIRDLAERPRLLTEGHSTTGHRRGRDEIAELEAAVQSALETLGNKVHATEARFRDLLGALPHGVREIDRSGRITYTNAAHARILGYEPDELLGTFVWDLAEFQSDRESLKQHWDEVLRGSSKPSTYRITDRNKNGEMVEIQVDWSHQLGPTNEPRGFICVVTDVTESAQAERELQASEARLSAVLENMPVMMGASDLEGKLALWNRECERVTGYSADSVLGKPWYSVDLFDPNPAVRLEHFEEWRRLRADYRNWEAEITCRDGSKKTVAWSSVSGRVPIPGWSSWSVGVDVTDRVRVKRSLAESEAMLRSITDSIPDIVMVADLDGTIRFVNHPAPGLQKEDVINTSVFDFAPERVRTRLKDAFECASRGESVEPFDGEYLGPDGTSIPYDVRFGRVPRTDSPIQLVMSCTDITERRRAEDRFRAHFKHFPMPTYTYQHKGDDLVLVDFNDAAYQVTGGQIPRLLGKSCRELYGDDPLIMRDFERCFRSRKTVRREFRYRFRTTGEDHELDVTYVFVPPDVVMLHADDIGDRKVAEEALRGSQESLAEAQRIAHIGNWDWNILTNELRWSDEIYRIFGLEPQEFGANYEAFLETVHPDDRDAIEGAVGRALRDRHPYSISHRILRKDGAECVVQEQAEVIYDDEGRPLRMVGTVQDVTLSHRAERQLMLALEEKETLLREMHHRVKNNLQVISSLLYLQSQKVTEAALTHLFEEMQQRVETMALIHENLYQSADLGRVDFRRYIEMLVSGLTAAHSGRSVRIEVEVEDVSLMIHTAVPCGLIVNELVTNAFRHAFVNGHDGTIRIQFRRADDRYVLSVRDDGIGLPADGCPSASLGLRLVHNLAEQLGARLETDRERGTAFRISFGE